MVRYWFLFLFSIVPLTLFSKDQLDSLKSKLITQNDNIELLCEISILQSRFNIDSSLKYLNKAKELLDNHSKNNIDSAYVKFAQSNYANSIGDEKLSGELLHESINQFIKYDNKIWLSKALLKLIGHYIVSFNFEQIDSLEKLFDLHVKNLKNFTQQENLSIQKEILKTHYYNYFGLYDLASRQAFIGLKRSQEIGNKFLEMKAYEALMSLYQMTNELPKSIEYLRKCIEITKKEAPIELYMRFVNLSVCELQQNNSKQAKVLLDSAMQFANYPKQRSFIYLMYGQYYAQEGNLSLAKSSIEKAKALFNENDNLTRIADCNFFLGDIQMEEGNFGAAEKFYKSYLVYHEAQNNAEQKFGGYYALSQLYSKRRDFKLAFEYANKCVYIQDTLHTEKKLKERKSQEIKYETDRKNRKISEQEIELELNKKRLFFIILSSLLAIASILFLHLYIINKNKRNILEIEKEKLIYQLDSIRGKILPHFSGNILNTITYFFETNENDKAIFYLSKFTELNKEILLCTEKPSRSLMEEKAFIENYIELEKLRYQDKLQFELNIDRDVDLNVNIPVLILHTFCENAIRHGIMSKNGRGVLSINISNLDNGSIEIKIDDDGIGRNEAAKLNTYSTKQGLKILFKQIELYNTNNENKIVIEMIDILKNTEVAGTTVKVIIPTKYNFFA
jgi:hypothetical protein